MRKSRVAAGADANDPAAPPVAGGPAAAASVTPAGEPATPTGHTPVVPRTVAGSFWVGAVSVALVLIALVIFLAQNARRVTIHFLGFDGRLSLALALLIALIGGALLVAIPGSVRILQLRKTVRQRTRRRR